MGRNRREHQEQTAAKVYRLDDFRKECGVNNSLLFEIWEEYCLKRYVDNISPVEAVESCVLSYEASTYLTALGLEYLTQELMGGVMKNG
jgi:hypothetical protein